MVSEQFTRPKYSVNGARKCKEKINTYMLIKEIATIKPMTPEQARIKALKTQKDNASKALKAERDKQKITQAQQQLAKVQSTIG